MPIEVGIWRLGPKLERLGISSLDREARLEEALVADVSILSPDLMTIGRQVLTSYGKFIDLIAMNADGVLSVIELKRDRTAREVVTQLLDYASWAKGLSHDDIAS